MRTFVAIAIPPDLKRRLRSEQRRLQERLARHSLPPVLRWTNTDNLHVTLRFLGETEAEQRRQMQAGLAEIAAAHRPFNLSLSRLGCFRSWSSLRVLWVGIRGETEALQIVQAEVESLTRRVGFEGERKRFSPHITLARTVRNAPRAAIRTASEQLRQAAAQEMPPLGIDWSVRDLYYIRSMLARPGRPLAKAGAGGGPHYSTLARCSLAPDSQSLR